MGFNFGSDLGSYLKSGFNPGNIVSFTVGARKREDPIQLPSTAPPQENQVTSNTSINTTNYNVPKPQVPIGTSGNIVFNPTP